MDSCRRTPPQRYPGDGPASWRLVRADSDATFASPPVVVGVTIGATNLYAPVPWLVGECLPPLEALGAHDNANRG